MSYFSFRRNFFGFSNNLSNFEVFRFLKTISCTSKHSFKDPRKHGFSFLGMGEFYWNGNFKNFHALTQTSG